MSPANGGAGGAIVNISSGSALIGYPLIYAMSKGALNSMSTAIQGELISQNIRINSISPGMTSTEMVSTEMAEKVAPTIPMKRSVRVGLLGCTNVGDAHSWCLRVIAVLGLRYVFL